MFLTKRSISKRIPYFSSPFFDFAITFAIVNKPLNLIFNDNELRSHIENISQNPLLLYDLIRQLTESQQIQPNETQFLDVIQDPEQKKKAESPTK